MRLKDRAPPTSTVLRAWPGGLGATSAMRWQRVPAECSKHSYAREGHCLRPRSAWARPVAVAGGLVRHWLPGAVAPVVAAARGVRAPGGASAVAPASRVAAVATTSRATAEAPAAAAATGPGAREGLEDLGDERPDELLEAAAAASAPAPASAKASTPASAEASTPASAPASWRRRRAPGVVVPPGVVGVAAAAWAAEVAGWWRWGRGCRQWQEGTGQQQVSAAQAVECGAAPVTCGLRAARCGLVASTLGCCYPEQGSAEGVAPLCGNLLASTVASLDTVGGSPCGFASRARADRTGISLKSCAAQVRTHVGSTPCWAASSSSKGIWEGVVVAWGGEEACAS